MKILDERETQKNNKRKNKQTNKKIKTKTSKGRTEAIVKGSELNDFAVHSSRVFSS